MQWTGWSLHEVCETSCGELFENSQDVTLALSRIRWTLIRHGFPSSATISFNMPKGGLLPKIFMIAMLYNFDHNHYNNLNQWEQWTDKLVTHLDIHIYV